MTTSTIIAIAVIVLVALAGLLLFASARRRDTDAALGQLSHETKIRDRGPVNPTADEPVLVPATGRPITQAEIDDALDAD